MSLAEVLTLIFQLGELFGVGGDHAVEAAKRLRPDLAFDDEASKMYAARRRAILAKRH